jgi:glycosyltransferase involved in cell wall biosynthesis
MKDDIRMLFIRTTGQSSMDLYSQWLGARIDATTIDTDIYQSSSELFNEPLLSIKSLTKMTDDARFMLYLRKMDQSVHFPNHHLASYPTDHRIIDRRYVLYVGSEHPRKNVVALINAMAIIRADPRFSDVILVKVGQAGGRELPFRQYTIKAIRAAGLDHAVHFTGFVDEADLPKYYSGAECTVLPSLIEGFGFPIVEAMACGSPVVASDKSSLPEIAGSAGISVDPTPASLSEALVTVLSDPQRRKKMISAGISRAAEFTWSRTAELTNAVYQSIC